MEQALANSEFDRARHRTLAENLGFNPRAMALAPGAIALSVQGREEEARRLSQEGLLGETHLRLAQPREALKLLNQALDPQGPLDERFHEAELHRLRGEALRALGQVTEAHECFLRALHLRHS
ncbi:MAG TPA: tetratricopeptide repeat protein [Myxococcaceae bacterium]